ncbi:MAG: thiolase family protein, partial [Paracoccaceae bacterium]
MKRQSYDGVAVAVPVSVPYVRYSIETAHWWIARALKELCDRAGIAHGDLDGLSVSSFTLH